MTKGRKKTKSSAEIKPINLLVLLEFFHLCENLKCILRHGWTSTGRQESVAEHTWRLSIMLISIAPYLEKKIKILKALKMTIIHDLVEIYAGDVPYFLAPEGSEAKMRKEQREHIAIGKINQILPPELGSEFSKLWKEYQRSKSYEARVVKALDKIEAQMQQNEASLDTWLECELYDATSGMISKYCHIEPIISELSSLVIEESKKAAMRNFHKSLISSI